jgi:Zn finger protein HypA/HybF involved in hydrogenase expression
MSISMEPFAAIGSFVTFDPYAESHHRVAVFQLQCRCCGFEPEEAVVSPRICPKCHSESWERFAKPGSILENADRYGA